MKKIVGFYFSFIVLLILVRLPFYLNINKYQLTFLNIGQGDSIYIKTPENCRIIIDSGKPNTLGDSLIQILPFNVKQLDLILITHPDLDHYGGFQNLVGKYNISQAIISPLDSEKTSYINLIKSLQASGTDIYKVEASSYLEICSLQIHLTAFQSNNANSSSIISHITFPSGYSFFSAGDISVEQELKLLKGSFPLNADIYKASHHGSTTSNSKAILDSIKPDYTVVQSGLNNLYNHPHFSVIKTLNHTKSKVLRNDLQGQIDFFFSGNMQDQSRKLELQIEY